MATIRTTAQTSEDTAEAEVDVKIPLSEVRKPLYASVGAADAAVKKILTLPTTYVDEVKKFSDRVNGISTQAQKLPTNVQTAVRSLPATVGSQLSDLQGRASLLYNSFADRGEKRVSSIRRSPVTEEAVSRTRTAVSQTKVARDSTRRAAEAVSKAVGDAAASD
ncbi:hypothetical protein [Frankia sp. CiP3]|uniref:hypothetical protein n=1 Tax=Frankia sp. CiP3 TaxID=2880971 RepID=UPI001EF47111|nr:hypothetical protein [Frankia sp. CiP3]